MAIDLRQVMAAFLTASMFLMLGNMIKRDHIDPLFENIGASTSVQYDVMEVSKQSLVGAATGLWTEQTHALKPCWKKPSSSRGREQLKGYIFFSLTNGPEYHVSQVANAVVVARHLGATLVLPGIRGSTLGEKRHFGEVYNVNRFITSLNGIVQVAKNQPAEVQMRKITTVKIPNRVSEDYIAFKIEPLFRTGRSLRLATYHPPSAAVANAKETKKNVNPYECLAMFQALELQKELKQLANSMIGILRSLSQKTEGQFIAVDLSVEMLGKTSCQENNASGSEKCHNAEEIGEFLKRIGFERDTTIYLTQSGWDKSLNALRDMFPNTFTKDAIMPIDGKARYLDPESSQVQKVIDYHICTQSDVFIPAYTSPFYASVAGNRIASGKTQILVPAEKTSTSANDYISPYISKKNHMAYSCHC